MHRSPPGRRGHAREQIAQLAARLIAQDGMDDYGAAKRKAARQLGVAESRELPANEEVEAALRAYRDLYQSDEHPRVLRRLRQVALSVMRMLEPFDPYITGSVLTGTAGSHSDINLELFVDSVKDVEMFLMARGIQYRAGDRRLYLAEGWRTVPVFSFEAEGVMLNVAVLARTDRRSPARRTENGRPQERARPDSLEAMLARD